MDNFVPFFIACHLVFFHPCIQFFINIGLTWQESTLVNVFYLALTDKGFLKIPFNFLMNENILLKVGKPRTRHGGTIKLQFFF